MPQAAAADTVIQKILTTVTPTPVALSDSGSITAATSTPGLSITSAGWFDASGKAFSGVFQPETYKIEIHVKADSGYVIASDVAAYLNNSAVTIQVENSGKTATIVREYTAAVWAPTIIKNPSAETVKEGGWASFAASASYVRGYEWYLEGPDGRQAVSVDDLHLTYPDVSVTGNGSSKLNIYNIPYDLNGWKAVCNFIGAGDGNSVKSQGALLTVIPTVSRPADSNTTSDAGSENAVPAGSAGSDGSPTAEGTGTSAADSSAVSAGGTESAPAGANGTLSDSETAGGASDASSETVSAAPATVYSNVWSSDARGHWHESVTSGNESRANEALHTFIWYNAEDGTQTGVCEVCGYTLTRRPAGSAAAATDASSAPGSTGPEEPASKNTAVKPGAPMILLMALAPVDIALITGHAVRSRSSKRHTSDI